MWIVRVALDRPYTFIVLAMLILILSPVVIMRTPVDIFPNIAIPVIAVAWQYTGLNPEEMEGRLANLVVLDGGKRFFLHSVASGTAVTEQGIRLEEKD